MRDEHTRARKVLCSFYFVISVLTLSGYRASGRPGAHAGHRVNASLEHDVPAIKLEALEALKGWARADRESSGSPYL